MKQEWIIYYLGEEHIVIYISKKEAGEHKLYLDGSRIEIEKKSYVRFVGFDQEFKIGHKIYHFVLNGSTADIATDGKYLNSKENYIPLKKLPWMLFASVTMLGVIIGAIIIDAPLHILIIIYLIELALYCWARVSGMKVPKYRKKEEK